MGKHWVAFQGNPDVDELSFNIPSKANFNLKELYPAIDWVVMLDQTIWELNLNLVGC